MSEHTQEPTLTVQGFTPYSRVPDWITRSGGKLSHGAVRLYAVIMSYADNHAHTAFPGRERLAEDMGVKPRTVSGYIKELEELGALIVDRRRNKRTGNFYSNHYMLVFDSPGAGKRTRPCATNDTPRGAQEVTLTKPTSLTTPTDVTTSTSASFFDDGSVNQREPEISSSPEDSGTLVNAREEKGDERENILKIQQDIRASLNAARIAS